MAGPTTAPRILLLDNQTSTVTGPAIGVQGDTFALGSGATNRNEMEVPIQVWVANMTASTTATVVVEISQDNSSYTTWGTFTFASVAKAQVRNTVGKLKYKYIRARISAISGAHIYAYMKIG